MQNIDRGRRIFDFLRGCRESEELDRQDGKVIGLEPKGSREIFHFYGGYPM